VDSQLAANARTDRYVAVAERDVAVPALGPIPFVAYQGDSSWIGYALIHGRWFSGPGEAVAPTNFFTQSGLHVGDQTAASLDGRSITVTLVGEIFDQARENRDDLILRGEWSDLATLAPTLSPTQWEVLPKSGVDRQAYVASLRDATNHAVDVQVVTDSSTDEGFLLFEGVISLLGAVLVAISLGGVLNTTLLETRQRTRETAVLKAIGMTPREVVGSVLASVVPAGLLAGLLGVPLGLGLQHIVLGFMGQAATKTDIPASALDVFAPPVLVALGLTGLAIAAIGAYLPAQRAARARIATVLQAE
jgi:putative ABC transport system permease protein